MNNKIKKIVFAVFALVIFVSTTVTSYANEIDTKVVNERWGKPTFVYGSSLTNEQRKLTMKLLGIEDEQNINSIKVNYKDLVNYIGGDTSNPSNMISSVLVTKENSGKGINVVIKTPKNITQITEEQYANASMTAGVEDATILVGAYRPVTGESALTGVYKAFEANGKKLDSKRMEVAQEELDTVNEITQANKDKRKFSSSNFNNSITHIKTQLSKINEKQDKIPTIEEIRNVVEESLEKYKLDNVITKKQVNKLIDYFEKYVNTDALTSKKVEEQLKKWGNQIIDGAKKVYDEVEKSGLLDRIAAFFRELYEKIVSNF